MLPATKCDWLLNLDITSLRTIVNLSSGFWWPSVPLHFRVVDLSVQGIWYLVYRAASKEVRGWTGDVSQRHRCCQGAQDEKQMWRSGGRQCSEWGGHIPNLVHCLYSLKSRGMTSPSFLPLNDFLKRPCQLSYSIIHIVYLFNSLFFHVKSFQLRSYISDNKLDVKVD